MSLLTIALQDKGNYSAEDIMGVLSKLEVVDGGHIFETIRKTHDGYKLTYRKDHNVFLVSSFDFNDGQAIINEVNHIRKLLPNFLPKYAGYVDIDNNRDIKPGGQRFINDITNTISMINSNYN